MQNRWPPDRAAPAIASPAASVRAWAQCYGLLFKLADLAVARRRRQQRSAAGPDARLATQRRVKVPAVSHRRLARGVPIPSDE
jgi:hypothetical protein